MMNAKFEKIVMIGTKFNDCNLTDVEITESNITGLKIDGVDISVLLAAIKNKKIDIDEMIK